MVADNRKCLSSHCVGHDDEGHLSLWLIDDALRDFGAAAASV